MGEVTKIAEHPILFSGEMVRAILAGKKTQTRRVIKPQPDSDWSPQVGLFHPTVVDDEGEERPGIEIYGASDENCGRKCLYGKPGDRLWVRESWGLHDTEPKDGPDGAHVYFKATDGDRHELRYQKWRPSIHMPRWASRLTLEITDIRVERVRHISEADAIAEGLEPTRPLYGDCGGYVHEGHKESFAKLWDEINGERGFPWYTNPWVWVIEFRRIENERA